MDQREQLTRHLTPHGAPLELGIRSTDIAEIVQGMEYAMLLGFLDKRQAAILMARHCQDEVERRKVLAWWKMECIERAHAQRWNRPRSKMVEAMAIGTLSEHLGFETRCKVCHGTRSREINKLVVTCPNCEGAGFLQYDGETWQAIIGCDATAYLRQWIHRLQWARSRLIWWEADAASALIDKYG